MMGTREKQGRWDCKTSAGWWSLKSNILLSPKSNILLTPSLKYLLALLLQGGRGAVVHRDLRICSARGRSQELNPANPKAEP